MFDCSTGKNRYHTREAAEEALLDLKSKFNSDYAAGPKRIYHCELCDGFHFTSSGDFEKEDPGQQSKIDLKREGDYWEHKFRR